MSSEDLERVKHQRDSLKKIMEKIYASLIGKSHRWNCGLKFNKECECEAALAIIEYEEFLFQEELFHKEHEITDGMDTKRY